MKSKIFSFKQMKENSRENLWIPVLLAIALFMSHTVFLMIAFGKWENSDYRPDRILSQCKLLWADYLSGYSLAVSIGGGILCGLVSFLYLHSQKKTDFYHSLPVKRRNLFVERLIQNVIYFVVPYGAVLFLSVCVCAFKGMTGTVFIGYAVRELAGHLAVFLCIYGVTSLAVILTGRPLMGILGTGAFLGYNIIIGKLLEGYMSIFFDTYNIDLPSFMVKILYRWGGPMTAGNFVMEEMAENNWFPFAVYLLVTALLVYVVLYVYEKRPAETAGRSMAFQKLGTVIKFFIQVPMILGMGLLFQYLEGLYKSVNGWFVFGIVFGVFFCHGLMEILYAMNFRKFTAHKIQFALITAIAGVIVCCFWFDWFHYDTYMPRQDKLTGISFDSSGFDGQYLTELEVDYRYGNSRLLYRDSRDWVTVDNSAVLYEYLKQIVDKERTYDHSENLSSMNVSYQLKSGRTADRTYLISSKEGRDLIEALYEQKTVKEQKFQRLEKNREYVESIRLEIMGTDMELYNNGQEERFAFFDALYEDIMNADGSVYMEYPVGIVELNYKMPSPEGLVFNKQKEPEPIMFADRIYLFPGYEKTMKMISDAGMDTGIEEMNISKIVISTYIDDVKQDHTYVDQETIEKLKPSLVSINTWCQWLDYMSNISVHVSYENQEGNSRTTEMRLNPNKLPTDVLAVLNQEESGE